MLLSIHLPLDFQEANKKTRAEAYTLLVELGSAMQEAIPAAGVHAGLDGQLADRMRRAILLLFTSISLP